MTIHHRLNSAPNISEGKLKTYSLFPLFPWGGNGELNTAFTLSESACQVSKLQFFFLHTHSFPKGDNLQSNLSLYLAPHLGCGSSCSRDLCTKETNHLLCPFTMMKQERITMINILIQRVECGRHREVNSCQ